MEELCQLYSPRTTLKNILESQSHLLGNLTQFIDRYTIQTIRAEFDGRGGSLSLIEFVMLLRRHFAEWNPEPTQQRTREDQSIEQAEISRGMARKPFSNRELKLTRCLLELYKEIDGGRDSSRISWEHFTNYIIGKVTQLKNNKEEVRPYTRAAVHLREKFASSLHKVLYIEELDRLAFFEESSDRVYFVNH